MYHKLQLWQVCSEKFRAFNQPIGNWNVSIVDRMDYMFATHCPFNQDIGNWNVSNVVLFNNMFHSAEEFNNGGESSINNWDMSSHNKYWKYV